MALAEGDWIVVPRVEIRIIEEPKVYACVGCKTHLSTEGNVISKDFTTQTGRGFLITDVVNVTNGPSLTRSLRTGKHVCEDVSCAGCDATVGWEYKDTEEKMQKYKIGKFVLEQAKITKHDWGRDKDGTDVATG
ncbi:unnamed protein product [Pylaiella littoralis]